MNFDWAAYEAIVSTIHHQLHVTAKMVDPHTPMPERIPCVVPQDVLDFACWDSLRHWKDDL